MMPSHSSITLAGQVVIMQTFSSKARLSISALRSRKLVAIQTGSVAASLTRVCWLYLTKKRLRGWWLDTIFSLSSHQMPWTMQCAQLVPAPAGGRDSS